MLLRLLLAGVLLLSGSAAQAQNWPQWRGPSGDSVSREQNLPVSWSEANGLAWKTALPPWGDSTPAIWQDAIFLTTQQEDKLLALKIRKSTGEIEWTRQVATGTAKREGAKREQKFHQLHNLASPSPVTDGKVVIFHFGTGDLAAFDFTGKALWARNLTQDFGGYTIWWGHANSPVLYENLVISVCMQDTMAGLRDDLAPNYVVAHDKLTGKEVWKSSRTTDADAEQCDSYTTPIFTKVAGKPQMLIMGGNQLDAYDPATGKQLWFVPGLIGGRTITGPTVGHDMVFVTPGMKGPIHALSLLESKAGKRLIDGRRDKQDALAWKEDQGTPDTCCPVLWEDLLFVVADNGIASCLNARTGQRQWRERLKGDFKASPVAAEGRVYFLNTKGLCTVVAAAPRYDKLNENQLDDETLASPAISDGRIYIRGKNSLYSIRKPE